MLSKKGCRLGTLFCDKTYRTRPFVSPALAGDFVFRYFLCCRSNPPFIVIPYFFCHPDLQKETHL